jgi:hypothetical protein
MKRIVALLFAAALIAPAFAGMDAQAIATPAAPALIAGDTSSAPTPTKVKKARKASHTRKARKQAAADHAAAVAETPAPTKP